jgi:hypothetical protein
MATNSLSSSTRTSQPFAILTEGAVARVLRSVFRALASLKLTVALFAMAIILIFVGTLAQAEKDLWEVVDQYGPGGARG